MTVKELIKRVRASTHDTDALEYSDEQLFNYINNGIRFVRRTILAIDPYLLSDTISGEKTKTDETLDDGTPVDLSVIDIEDGFSSIIRVIANGQELYPINPYTIKDEAKVGSPKCYYALGLYKIGVYPIPQDSLKYRVIYVPDMIILKNEDDVIPFTNDIIDFIVEYAVIRASIVNEFDVSQESQIMSVIINQIENLLRGVNKHDITVDGYWSRPIQSNCDYGWGRRV